MSCGALAKVEEPNLIGLLECVDRFVSSSDRRVSRRLSQLHLLTHFSSESQRLHPIVALATNFHLMLNPPRTPPVFKVAKVSHTRTSCHTRLPFPFVPSPPQSWRSAALSGGRERLIVFTVQTESAGL